MAAKQKTGPNPFVAPSGTWENRVVFASYEKPYAFRPRQILCTGDEMVRKAKALIAELTKNEAVVETFPVFGGTRLCVSSVDIDVEAVVARLRQQGFRAEPNYVFFNHGAGGCGCGCCVGSARNPFNGNPFVGNPFVGNPFVGNPFVGNPFVGNPFVGNPFVGNPFVGNPFVGNAKTGERPSSARPDKAPDTPAVSFGCANEDCDCCPKKDPEVQPKAFVLDTGIALIGKLPSLLASHETHRSTLPADRERPDELNDGFLDPISGHGTFIAGILEQIAPGQPVKLARVLSTVGDGDAASIAKRIDDLLASGEVNKYTVFNMSFGSYGDVEMYLIADTIRAIQDTGAVVVASAGNDTTSLPSYPACLDGVIGVGSIEACGAASYTNFGCWVRACAPGTDVISTFYKTYDGNRPLEDGVDIDNFTSGARWTGTSFSAPIVAGVLLRHMALTGSNAEEAVEAVVDNPSLMRFPGLGTVVNVTPGI